ncbi:MAG: chorismate-binding protein [Muribaculaceae bacterium]|nr:chorismate-binding protein [Muribaculaceae bacterium]
MFPLKVKEYIQNCIDKRNNFAVFRFPGEDVFHIAGENGYIFKINEFGAKSNGAKDVLDYDSKRLTLEAGTRSEDLKMAVSTVINRHKKLGGGKTVVSCVFRGNSDRENLIERINEFFELNKENFCFIMQATPGQIWVSATPELLLSLKEGKASTIALAGTRRVGEKNTAWDDKNKNEQQIVTDHIVREWRTLGLNVNVGEPRTRRSCHIEHICTDISADVPRDINADQLIDAIYPTPAILGYPVDFAKKNISELETHKRNFFAGYVTVCSPDGSLTAYVILRCACIDVLNDYDMNIYCGCGITEESDYESEKKEYLDKSHVLRTVLGKDFMVPFDEIKE